MIDRARDGSPGISLHPTSQMQQSIGPYRHNESAGEWDFRPQATSKCCFQLIKITHAITASVAASFEFASSGKSLDAATQQKIRDAEANSCFQQ
jgi:hypothetical protein